MPILVRQRFRFDLHSLLLQSIVLFDQPPLALVQVQQQGVDLLNVAQRLLQLSFQLVVCGFRRFAV